MEMDTSEDSSTGDTRQAVVDPGVPVIPDAGAGDAQAADVPASSSPEMEVDTPEDSSTGDTRQDVVAPDVPVSPVAGMDVDTPKDSSTGDSRVAARDSPQVPSEPEPVAGPSQDRTETSSLSDIMRNFKNLLARVKATSEQRSRERVHLITDTELKELMDHHAELSSQSHSWRLYPSAKLKDGESVSLIESNTEERPETAAEDPLHNFMDLMERVKADYEQRARERASLMTDAEFKELMEIESQLSSQDHSWMLYPSAKLKDGESVSLIEINTEKVADREAPPEPKAGPSWRETDESSSSEELFNSFMDLIKRTKAISQLASSESVHRGTGTDFQELKDLYGGNSSEDKSWRLYPSSKMQEGESVSLIESKFEKWKTFWEAHRPDEVLIPRPTTPTVEVRSPISDFKFWDEDAQLEPPTGTMAETSLQEVSAMDTSKQSSSVSGDTLKQSPPTAVVEAYLKEIRTMDIPQLSPLSSMDDVSKHTSSTSGTSKLSPPPSVDDVSKGTTYTLDVSKGTSSNLDEDSHQQPDNFASDASRFSSSATSDDTSRQSRSSSAASRTSRKRLLEKHKDQEGSSRSMSMPESKALIKAEAGKALSRVLSLVAIPGDEARVKAEAERALARVLSQVAQSPQRSPLRVPGDASSQSSSAASNDASRQSQSRSSSAASGVSRKRLLERDEEDQEGPNFFMTVPESDAEIKSEAGKVLAKVLSQVESPESSPPRVPDETSQEEVTAMDTSKLSPVSTMDDVSKGTSSTFDEEIYLNPDTLVLTEEDTRSRQSAEGGDAEKALNIFEVMIQNEAAAEQILAQVLSQVCRDSPQPGPSGLSARDSPQPGPSGLSREQVIAAQMEPNYPTREAFRRKTLKVLGTRMYFCTLPERDEVKWLMKAANLTFRILKEGNAPFNFFIDFFGDIITNQWLMFELVKASDTERAALNSYLERLCKENYTKMLKLEKLIRKYVDEGVNHYCYGMLEYIRATVHQLDVFNHPVYRTRGLTSISNKRRAAGIWNHIKISLKNNKSKRIRKKKNVGSVTSEYVNRLENARLENKFYEKFYPTYNFLRKLMQCFRREYMPEGVVFALDELPVMRDESNPFNRELAVILSTDMLENYLKEDLVNQSVLMDRSSMCEYVESYIAKEYKAEDNFNKLFRQLVARIPSREQEDTEEDSEEVQALKNVLFKDYRIFVEQLEELEPFNFLIEAILLILAKTMDLLLCLDLFTEKFITTEQLSRQRIRDRPEQVDYNKRFDQYVAEIKNVVAGLQEYVYRKIISIQVKLKSIKNVHYGGAYNEFVDLCRLRIHMLDCINTDRRMYESAEYNSLTDKTSDDLWVVKSNQVTRYQRSAFRYNGPTPLDDLPYVERDFIHKQTQLYLDKTYRKAVRALLALCNSVGTLEVAFKIKIQEIMSYTSPEVDDDAGVAAAAAAVVAAAVDVADAVVVGVVAAAADVAGVAANVADAAAVVDNMVDAAATTVDMVDVAAAAVDTAAAAAGAADNVGDV